eukprot:TRINITY_DN17790_c0_g1_i1.p1 TRINITY_DN17790_c0_g1~~TRINITY_DN17790_c0_g1_i1.p1  ORF type:complete len:286 (-),score=72.63 TRINITY_DN17790_c0_g1_i1:107-964(-)
MIGPRPRRDGVGTKGGLAAMTRKADREKKEALGKQHDMALEEQQKEKEFAWMSDDDVSGDSAGGGVDNDDVGVGSSGGASSQHGRCGAKASTDKEEPRTRIEDIDSFSEMMRLAPGLQRRASRGDMSAEQLASTCAAAARVRFYDADLLAVVTKQVLRLSSKRNIACQDLIVVLSSLADLNAYDKTLFSAAASQLALSKTCSGLKPEQRKQLVDAFRSTKHQGDDEFIESMVRRLKSERYEEAKDELWKRNMTRMYGETYDLQGPSEDTERALLKKRRTQVTRER